MLPDDFLMQLVFRTIIYLNLESTLHVSIALKAYMKIIIIIISVFGMDLVTKIERKGRTFLHIMFGLYSSSNPPLLGDIKIIS